MPLRSLISKFLATALVFFPLEQPFSAVAEPENDSVEARIKSQTQPKWLVILSVERDFHAAKREAERASNGSGVKFSLNGQVFDNKRGLILPDDPDVDGGQNMWRRYNEHPDYPRGYISIEKSDSYSGLRKGNYIVVGAICDSSREAEAELRRFKRFAQSAHVAKTEIYMGCIH